MLTMLPRPCETIAVSSCFMLRIVPSTFVSNVCGVALRRLVGNPAWNAFRSGRVHRRIQAAEACDDLFDEPPCVFVAANIRTHELRFGAECPELSKESGGPIPVASRDDEPRTLAGEGDRRGATDAREGASDENGAFRLTF